ncbi:MAG: HD domain-containing protein [SAR324 cluster bacterium]|nr:HD domain-containing protein [SAR324 cluster bacterium]
MMGSLQARSSVMEVGADDLKQNMRIKGITSFASQFQSLDQHTCSWLKKNFSQAKAKAQRSGAPLEIAVDELEQGDHLTKIYDFPSGFKRFDSMSEQLFGELKRRGFLTFDAEILQTAPKTNKRAHSISYANQILAQIATGVRIRDELSDTLKETFVKIEQGSLNISDMQEITKSVLKNTSVGAMTAIANLKESEQTYAHCIDVGAIFLDSYHKSGMAKTRGQFSDAAQVLLAGFLHDIGKAKVAKAILESTERFEVDSPEMQSMRSHPVKGAEILASMGMPRTVCMMAGQHHVKINSELMSNYPPTIGYDQVLPESRLLSIVDVYQALVGKRKYKKAWSPAEAMRYLDSLAGIEYGQKTYDLFLKVIGKWPIGTLVELNDGSMAFVINQGKTLDTPWVIQIISSAGEQLTKTPILDLDVEKDMKIVRDHHVEKVFEGEDGMEIFANLKVC